ncbi:MAG: molybdopterin-binding protein [Geminicoccaceae bacterium]
MESAPSVTACLVIIGNEILSGRTQDANLAWIAQALNGIGIQMREARVVPDDEAEIIAAINAVRVRYDYVFTTGGIGPTHDDITAPCIARAFGLKFGRNAEAERRLVAYYPPDKLNDARLRMADTPEGAELIDNPVSAAPGFRVENVYVLPGVPRIMQAMFDGLKGKLAGGATVLSRTVVVFFPEGEIAKPLAEVQERHPAVEIGSYPFMRFNQFGTSLVFRGTDRAALDAAVADLLAWTAANGVGTEEPL